MDTRAVNVLVNGGTDYRATAIRFAVSQYMMKEGSREQGNVIFIVITVLRYRWCYIIGLLEKWYNQEGYLFFVEINLKYNRTLE